MSGAIRRLSRIRSANRPGVRSTREPDFEDIRECVKRLALTADGSKLLSWLEDVYLLRPAPFGSDPGALSEREGQRRLVHQILGMVDEQHESRDGD